MRSSHHMRALTHSARQEGGPRVCVGDVGDVGGVGGVGWDGKMPHQTTRWYQPLMWLVKFKVGGGDGTSHHLHLV